jgi:cytochrome c oxidase subunit 3
MSTIDERLAPADRDPPILQHHFSALEQQHESTLLGMWGFLATEIMFFGGLFLGYIVYRTLHPDAFIAASRKLNVALGGINTAVLLTSSLAMALAVRASQLRQRTATVGFLVATIVLGFAFLGIKGTEYYQEYREHLIPALNFTWKGADGPHVQMFFVLYFFMTGLHAVHMIIGITLIAILAALCWRRWLSGGGGEQIEVVGLYWHFVDIIWVFLYPLLYLIDVHR